MEICDELEGGREGEREDRREGGEGGGDMDVLSGPYGGRQTEQWSTGNLECPLLRWKKGNLLLYRDGGGGWRKGRIMSEGGGFS